MNEVPCCVPTMGNCCCGCKYHIEDFHHGQARLDSIKFLGRTFDHDTMTYVFSDGSGRVPEEMRQDVINATYERNCFGRNGLHVLATLFAWKDRLESNALVSGQPPKPEDAPL